MGPVVRGEAHEAGARVPLGELESATASGEALCASARDRLVTIYQERVAELIDEAAATTEPAKRAARIKAAEDWGSDELLQDRVSEWVDAVEREVEEWTTTVAERIDGRVRSASFMRAFSAGGGTLRLSFLKASETSSGALKKAGKALGGVDKDKVVRTGHRMGYKFKPWEAVKLAKRLKVAGAVAGAAAGTYEIYSAFRAKGHQDEDDKRAAEERRRALEAVRHSAREYFDEGSADQPSPKASIDEVVGNAADALREVEAQLVATNDELAERGASVERLEQATRHGRELLGD